MKLSIYCSTIMLFVLTGPLFAQTELDTDRPNLAFSASTIEVGALQVESGFQFFRVKRPSVRIDSLLYPTTFVRYGLLKRLEIGIFGQYVTRKEVEVGEAKRTISGIDNLRAGIKVKLLDQKGVFPALGLLLHAIIPTGGVYRENKLNPDVHLLMNHRIGENFELNYNLGWEGRDEFKRGIGIYSLVVQYKLTENFKAYFENHGEAENMKDLITLIDGGLLFLLTENLQLDISAGKNLNEATHYFDTGISFRLPN